MEFLKILRLISSFLFLILFLATTILFIWGIGSLFLPYRKTFLEDFSL